MTKSRITIKKSKKSRSAPQSQGQARARAPSMVNGKQLGPQARAHVNLLEDPCAGPLTHPIYPGSEQGAVMRFSSLASVNVGGSNDSGVFVWCPGTAQAGTFFSVGGGTSGTLGTVSAAQIPGSVFLNNNSCSFRAVAACLEAFTTSSEMNRAGYFGFGNNQADAFNSGSVYNPNEQLNNCTVVTRTPDKRLGIRWLPNVSDMSFNNFVGGGLSSDSIKDCGNLLFAWTGHQAAVPITLKLTVVYEVVFLNAGIPNVLHRNPSSNTADDVLASFWQRNKSTILDFSEVAVGAAIKWGTAALMAA